MSHNTKQIANLNSGVSQQPYPVRFDSQGDEQINMFSSPVTGLRRRKPSRFIAGLGAISDNAFVYPLTTSDDSADDVLVIDGNSLQIVDYVTGVQKTIDYEDTDIRDLYLAGGSETSIRKLKAITASDTTLITNTEQVVASTPGDTNVRNDVAVVWVKQGRFGKTYAIGIDGVTQASYTTLDGSSTSHQEDVDTANIANELFNDLVANIGVDYTIEIRDNILIITKDDGGDFSIECADGYDNAAMYSIKDRIQLLSDLPRKCKPGLVFEIVGGNVENPNSYYVKFIPNAEGASGIVEGIWEETVNDEEVLDNTTLPIRVIRDLGGFDYAIQRVQYLDRQSGDSTSAPSPSFVGNTVNALAFWKSRFVFGTDEAIIASEQGNFEYKDSANSLAINFWPTSIAAALATDPIDLTISNLRRSIVRNIVPWDDILLIFTDNQQLVYDSGGQLSAETVSITPVTKYEADRYIQPQVAGSNIFFNNETGRSTEIREYFVNRTTSVREAANITAHIPTYIPSGIRQLITRDNNRMLALTTTGAIDTIFIYQYLWDGDQKVQSAWHKWVFEDKEVVNAFFVRDRMYVLLRYSDGNVYVEEIDVSEDFTDEVDSFITHLDRKVFSEDGNITVLPYDVDDTTLELQVPYQPDPSTSFVVAQGDGTIPEGRIYPVESVVGDIVTIKLQGDKPDDVAITPLIFGEKYLSSFTFGQLLLRDQNGNGVTSGRTQLQYGQIEYQESGEFDTVVKRLGTGAETVKSFNGRVMGSLDNRHGAVAISSGSFRFPVRGVTKDVSVRLESSSHLPCGFLFFDFEYNFFQKARRTG